MSLAERVKQRRIELGLTQTEAAEKAGIRQQSWASIEEGKTLKPRNIVGIEALDGSCEYVMTDMDWSQYTFALKIVGDSMEPDFKAGDVIIVDPEIEPAPGEFVVAKNGEHEATFKKYRPTTLAEDGRQHFELIPLNDDYPVMRSIDRHIQIIGTMVEHRIYRRKR